MEDVRVSIIMNCHNCEQYLTEAIKSIYAQSINDWEIIFWDNFSTDRGPEIVKSFDERIKYYKGEEFLPIGAARNLAVQKAEGEFITFLDTDDMMVPTHLESLLNAFKDDTDAVYSNFVIKDMSTNETKKPFNPEYEFHEGHIAGHLAKKNFIWLQALMVKAEAVKKLDHAFDAELMTAEDYDFILRLALNGKFRFISDATLIYRMHDKNITSTKQHYFIHDFPYLIRKYRTLMDARMLKDLTRQYLMNVRIDLSEAGFRVFPFIRLGLSLRQIMISMVFAIFPDRDIWALKNRLSKPFEAIRSVFSTNKSKSSE